MIATLTAGLLAFAPAGEPQVKPYAAGWRESRNTGQPLVVFTGPDVYPVEGAVTCTGHAADFGVPRGSAIVARWQDGRLIRVGIVPSWVGAQGVRDLLDPPPRPMPGKRWVKVCDGHTCRLVEVAE